MTKRGYFIINGIPRVVINQIMRQSGIYYQQSIKRFIKSKSRKITIKRYFYVDLISQRGTWLRFEIDKHDSIWARMKKTPRIPALLLLQSIGFNKKSILQTLLNLNLFSTSVENFRRRVQNSILEGWLSELILPSNENTEILLQAEKQFVCRKFLNPRSYNLGKAGRSQLNKKLRVSVPITQTTLTPYDLLLTINSLIQLFQSRKKYDDIDHLANRRVRASGELIQHQLSLGLIRLENRLIARIQKEKEKEKESLQLQNLFTSRAINSIFKEFFGSSPLSQFLDQANPLAELTQKRRFTSTGPGGINRETAGMAVRGIHPTHYGRICPIETPEGQNAGLVNSMTALASLNNDGFLESPFFIIYKGQIQKQLGAQNLSAEFSQKYSVLLSNIKPSQLKFLPNFGLISQTGQKFKKLYRHNIHFIAISYLQLISIATSLIPFIEHNDANRALMGSNMQRQAVPLIGSERPLVGTGFENRVLFNSADFLQSKQSGIILYSSHQEIRIFHFCINIKRSFKEYKHSSLFSPKLAINCPKLTFSKLLFSKNKPFLTQYKKKSQNLILSKDSFQKVILFPNFNKRKFLFDRTFTLSSSTLFLFHFLKSVKIQIQPSTFLKVYPQKIETFSFSIKFFYKPKYFYLGKKQLNHCFKSRSKNRTFSSRYQTSVSLMNGSKKIYMVKANHILQIRDPLQTTILLSSYIRSNQGTCFIQKPFGKAAQWIEKGDLLTNNFSSDRGELALGQNILVGYLPWEGYNFEDAILINEKLIYNDIYTSLHIEKYKIEIRDTPFGLEQITCEIPDEEQINLLDHRGIVKIGTWVEEGDLLVGRVAPMGDISLPPYEQLLYDIVGKQIAPVQDTSLRVPRGVEGRVINIQIKTSLNNNLETRIESASIFILESKKIKVGDKIAGRHGNKGIVSKVLSEEDMPYYPDGTCLDMILNPLGVPSRMNIGQLFESLLGLIGKKVHKKFKISPFDERVGSEASRSLVFFKLYKACQKVRQRWVFSPDFPGKFRLFDGRNGTNFAYPIMSGISYMMKLIHLVDEKIHARSTGSYSLVTQQPLKGRSKFGGQRFGEMEVWALEGFGVAYTLQELLTIKSDDVRGRAQILKAILDYSNFRFGTPEAFKVLIRELRALCLDVKIKY